MPKGIPKQIIDLLSKELNAAMGDPKVQTKMVELGGMLIVGSPEDFGRINADETEKWAKS